MRIDINLPFNGWRQPPHGAACGGISTAIPQSVLIAANCLARSYAMPCLRNNSRGNSPAYRSPVTRLTR